MPDEAEMRLRERLSKLGGMKLLRGTKLTGELARLQEQLDELRADPSAEEIWESVELARHPDRPYTLDVAGVRATVDYEPDSNPFGSIRSQIISAFNNGSAGRSCSFSWMSTQVALIPLLCIFGAVAALAEKKSAPAAATDAKQRPGFQSRNAGKTTEVQVKSANI